MQTETQQRGNAKVQTIERGDIGTQTGMDQTQQEAPKAKTTGLGAFMERYPCHCHTGTSEPVVRPRCVIMSAACH